MSTRLVRMGIVVGLIAFLLMFFLPLLPFTQTATGTCSAPGPGGIVLCTAIPWGGSYSGHQSIGNALTSWGATYSNWYANSQNFGGYVPPTISYNLGDGINTFTASGALFFVILPVIVVCSWLLAPEMVRVSRISRIGFIALNGFVLILSVLILITAGQQIEFPRLEFILGSFFAPMGLLMVFYGACFQPLRSARVTETTVG